MKTTFNKQLIAIGGRHKVCPDDVILLKGDSNYTKIFLRCGKTLIVATTLKALEKRFSQCWFFRTHKSYLINLQYVIDFEIVRSNDNQKLMSNNILMQNDFHVEISRRKKTKFYQELNLL